ncbi:MAG: hypothetical protein HY343_05155 [Lentisphaerae bacterium]|nr:hypothetical protein [Lentisphaerota bacterium]
MNYDILETLYGPGLRPEDWAGEGAGNLHYDAAPPATLSVALRAGAETVILARTWHPLGSGGDVEVSVNLEILEAGAESSCLVKFNHQPNTRAATGISVRAGAGALIVCLKDREIARRPGGLAPGRFQVRLATLGEFFAVWVQDDCLVEGRMDPPFTDNEGWLAIEVRRTVFLLRSVEERAIAHRVAWTGWTRSERLFSTRFEALADWTFNGAAPKVADGACVFQPVSLGVLNRLFEGPLAVECRATPLPAPGCPSAVSDAIFLWMLTHPQGDLLEYLRGLPDAALRHYMPLAFYWMDFGGTNNATTRLRKNPNRHLIRQFTDPARLLTSGRTYAITLVQAEHQVEFWVDGRRWIRAWDARPLRAGHIAFRSLISPLVIRELAVWRILPCSE